MSKPVVTFGEDKRMPITARCLYCGYGPLDAATCMEFQTPEQARGQPIEPGRDIAPYAGALTLCCECGALLVFAPGADGKLGVRAAGEKDLADLKSDPDVWKAVCHLRKHMRRRWGKKS